MAKISQQTIIDTAAQLIATKKTTDISLTQIATTLGITHAALYKHFDSKQAIWEAVAGEWFQKNIIDQVKKTVPTTSSANPKQQLHDWLWAFVTAKKAAYRADAQMFTLNTEYIDNNPVALRRVLTSAYQEVDRMMAYHDVDYQRAETIMTAFGTFMLPNFRASWDWPDYQARFEAMWALIEPGV